MSTIDRYIARQYLFNVVALLVLLFCFIVAVDVALNIDQFLSAADRLNGDTVALSGVRRLVLAALGVFDLWWPRLLQLYGYMVGLVLAAAMGFTFTQMVRSRELVAVLAGGISLHRLMRPVLIVTLAFLGLKVVNQELVLSRPEIAPLLTRGISDIGKRSWKAFPITMVPDQKGRVFLARNFDPSAQRLDDVIVWVRQDGVAQMAVLAPQAVWRDGGWDLKDPTVQLMQLSAGGSAVGAGRPEVPTRITTDLDPEALKFMRYKAFSQTLSWWQIGEMLSSPLIKEEMRAELQRVRWSRVSQVLSAILGLLITMPFYLLREPRNMLAQSIKSAPVAIVSLMGGILLSSLPWPGLPPGFAVFIPVLILAPMAIAMLFWLKT